MKTKFTQLLFAIAMIPLVMLASEGAQAQITVTPTVATCGPGSLPEYGLQGQVSRADRLNGRNQQGYSCNLQLVGQYQGRGAGWVSSSFDKCAYMPTSFYGLVTNPLPGVQVIDVSNPAAPKLSTRLTSPAMAADTWESLKVNPTRKLLGGASGDFFAGVGGFDVYDISTDCAHPVYKNASRNLLDALLPKNILGHEGNWAPDGKTYYSSGAVVGSMTAIDVSNPASTRIIWTGLLVGGPLNHGLALNQSGTRLYVASMVPGGVIIYNVSAIQNRALLPIVTQVGQVSWAGVGGSQHVIPVTYSGKPYLIVPSEVLAQGISVVDISNEKAPKLVATYKLQIQLPENKAQYDQDSDGNGFFGYESHYCEVNTPTNPTLLACGYFGSGIRVFNIANPLQPKEIAYYNPPAQMGKASILPGSEHAALFYLSPTLSMVAQSSILQPTTAIQAITAGHDLFTDWCTSPPRFVGNQLWVTCQDNGFMVLQFTNGVYPQ